MNASIHENFSTRIIVIRTIVNVKISRTHVVIIHKYVCEGNDYKIIIREMIWGHCQGKGQQIPTEKLALTPQIKQHLSISLMLLCG